MIAWLALDVARAGVWVRDAGQGYAQLSYVHQESGRLWLPGEGLVDQTDPALLGHLAPLFDEGRFAANDVNAYVEYGLGSGFEATASLPLRFVQNRWSLAQGTYPDIVQTGVGLGDLTVGGRFGGKAGPVAWSAYTVGRLPLYDNRPTALFVAAGNSDFEDDKVPRGQGTLELEPGGSLGVGGKAGWALAEVGLRFRSYGFSAVLPARLQGGIKPVDRVAAWVGADLAAGLGNGDAPDFFRDEWGKGPIVVDNQSSLTLSVGTQVEVDRGFGVLATVSQTVWGSRFPALFGAQLGVTWRFDTKAAP